MDYGDLMSVMDALRAAGYLKVGLVGLETAAKKMITTRHKLTRYGTSLAVVLGVHAIAIAIALHWSAPRTVQLPPAAMVIDLAPMPAPPPPAPPKVVTPPQPPAPVEELPLPKLAEAPKPTIQVPKPVKPKPKPQPPKPEEKKPEPPKEKTFRDAHQATRRRPIHRRRNRRSPHRARRRNRSPPKPPGKAPCWRTCRSTKSTRKARRTVARKA